VLPGLVGLLLVAPHAVAQTGGIEPGIEDGRRIYMVEQFARFAPQTAADVVGQIPGFSVTNVSNDRGLGEASQNVLINGQRITGKGNDAMTVLRRIPVDAVQRFEILDGAMLDISGLSGHVLNVITEQGNLQGNFAWRPQFRRRVGNHLDEGEVNLSGKTGLGDFTAGLKLNGFRGGGWGGETEYRPATDVSFFRSEEPRFAYDGPKLSGSFNRTRATGSILNLNASLGRDSNHRHVVTRFQVPGGMPTTEDSQGRNHYWATEIGGDYEFAAGAGRAKFIGFFSNRRGQNLDTFTTLVEGDPIPTGARFGRDSKQGERVARAEYRWKALDADWTVSSEVAWNFVDATGSLAVLDDMGQFQPADLPGATSRVEERRGESILSFSRPVGSGWSLQVSGGGEYSQLQQDGAEGNTRNFWRPKGAVSLAWNPPSQWELNLKLQRRVGQLDFYDFLASVDLDNNNANGGNPELVPPQIWLLQLELIRSLGPMGKIRLNLEGQDITDLVEQVPLSATTEAPGNIDSAQRASASLNVSLLLDGIGIPGGKLDTYFTAVDSRVRDPLTGTHRRLSGNCCYWNVDFRHDVPGTMWTWGVFGEQQSRNHSYRLDYQRTSWESRPYGSVFVEHKDVLGLKVRAEIGNLFRSRDRSYQVAYVDRRDGPVDYTRDFGLSYGWIYRVRVSGTF
jgi:hypothetical protein